MSRSRRSSRTLAAGERLWLVLFAPRRAECQQIQSTTRIDICVRRPSLSRGDRRNNLYLADLTQATFVPGTPGSWSGPQSVTTIIGSLAGLSGATVAPRSGHLATVTSEFGDSSFAVLRLPATSGKRHARNRGLRVRELHRRLRRRLLSAHAHGVYQPERRQGVHRVRQLATGAPDSLAVVDVAGVLAKPRAGDGHTVIGCLSDGDGLTRFVATH